MPKKSEFNGTISSFGDFRMENIAESVMERKPVIACISDSPKLTSGFANVARPIYQGFYEAGFDIHVFGLMDDEPDKDRTLPYPFWHCDVAVDQLLPRFLIQLQPDVVFLLTDPGSALSYTTLIAMLEDKGKIKKTKVVLYTPIEGYPTPTFNAQMFAHIIENGGRVVLYSPGMIDLFESQYNIGYKLDYAYHGSDHANFRKYERDERENLRLQSGLDKYFVIGSFGVNKRTKGFDILIYTAQVLKSMNKAEDIKFYFHTSKKKSTLQGYDLEDLSNVYGVRDMIIFKPEEEKEPGGNIRGIPRERGAAKMETFNPSQLTPRNKKNNFSKFSYIDRLNVLDLYFDASQVEGLGLPAFEAMRCGVPTVSIEDNTIRSEVYTGAVLIKPEPFRFWTTWQTGVRLPVIDPQKCANMILYLKNNPNKLKIMSDKGIEDTKKFSWKETQHKFNEIMREVLNV